MEGFDSTVTDWSDSPIEVRELIAGMLAKDPDERIADYAEIRKCLTANIEQLLD